MDQKLVESIEFGILSPSEIERMSVVEVEHVEMYENKMPKIGSLTDPRMGCIEKDHTCYTCQENINNCPGHFGHIKLNMAVYHIGFLKTVKKILECICPKCSRFRLLPTDPKYKKLGKVKDKFQYAWEICKNKTVCEYEDCESQILPIRKIGMQLYYDTKKMDKNLDKIYLFADEVLSILTQMSDKTCRLIGLNPKTSRPEWMIITVLPVPPPCIRPSVRMDSGRGEDDLTHVLINIIKTNNELKKFMTKRRYNNNMLAKIKEQLQYNVVTYFDNDVKTGISQNLQRGSRPIKSISSRLKGKQGRIRGNLMGKRVDFSARTVITGDPTLSIDELGVPKSIAQNLTFPEKVFALNLNILQQLVDNSPEYPSAKYVVKSSGARVYLRYAKKKPQLEIGDIVERDLVDGDTILFNRQPTLHKMSMMAHKVKVMPYSTFRMNVNVCASYNADFDGDEMNLHAPQSLECITELNELSTVSKLLVSSQSNKPVNSLVQDSVSSIRKFTKRDLFLCREQVMQLLMIVDMCDWNAIPTPCILKPKKLWSGKQIFSMFLPKINFMGYHSTHPEDENTFISPGDTRVIIQNGDFLSGIICKKTVGTSSGGILHIIFNDHGPEVAKKFLDQTSQTLNHWMLHHGFSVGIGDALIDASINDKMIDTLKVINKDIQKVTSDYKNGTLVPLGNRSIHETKEVGIQNLLSKARDSCGKLISRSFHDQNNIKQMVDSGSKGSIMNICQISACVGQQLVEGNRLPNGFKNRTLPHFDINDESPESKGFVSNSFLKGLTPQEMFFHAMGGREGVIDTAVKTASTGYLQRRLVKSMEDLVVQYDYTVRDSNGNIVQISYGDDNIDGVGVEWNTFPTMNLSNDEFECRFKNKDCLLEWERLLKDRDILRGITTDDRLPMPMNIHRMLVNLTSDKRQVNTISPSPEYIFNRVIELRKKLTLVTGKWEKSLFGILMNSVLSTRQVLERWKLSKQEFDCVVSGIEIRYNQITISPGENVGIIAAQSIGEPATQMTLNTFHLSGTGNKTVTTGIPRLQELINSAKHINTPGMRVYFTDSIRFCEESVRKMKYKIECTCLCHLVSEYKLVDDHINSDKDFLDILNEIPDQEKHTESHLYPCMLRLVISRKELYNRNISMTSIIETLYTTFEDTVYIQASSENYKENPIMYIRLVKDTITETDDVVVDSRQFWESILSNLLDNIIIAGVPGIEKTFITDNTVVMYDESGNNIKRTEYIIETDDINIREIVYIKGVDITRIECNDPQEMNNTFGIEIARKSLMNEIKNVITDSGAFINYRHLSLLCEVMTNQGFIMSITRHGVGKTDINPLSKCTFEQPVDILLDAAKEGKRNKINGISENILLGQLIKSGTGMIDVLPMELPNENNCRNEEYQPLNPSYLKRDVIV